MLSAWYTHTKKQNIASIRHSHFNHSLNQSINHLGVNARVQMSMCTCKWVIRTLNISGVFRAVFEFWPSFYTFQRSKQCPFYKFHELQNCPNVKFTVYGKYALFCASEKSYIFWMLQAFSAHKWNLSIISLRINWVACGEPFYSEQYPFFFFWILMKIHAQLALDKSEWKKSLPSIY